MSESTALLAEIDVLKARVDALRDKENAAIVHALDLEYTYDSNRIEGNTLTLRETELVIDKGLTIGGKSMREHLEAVNHYEAVQVLRELVRDKVPLSETLTKQLHGLILRGIDRANAGRYRGVPVMIGGSRYTPPQPWQVPKLMEDCCLEYQQQRADKHPVLLAAWLHERIATIHPFIDGNGRTARLVMNLVLLQHGYSIANIPGDTESRLAYYAALERCNLENDLEPFLNLIAGYVRQALQRWLAVLGEK